jgi:hypothetical protein
LRNIKTTRKNGGEFIDMREIFNNYPQYLRGGNGEDIIGNVKIGGNQVLIHIQLAIYDDMRINIFPYNNRQTAQFSGQLAGKYRKEGYWYNYEYTKYGGGRKIPMMTIQTPENNINFLFNYLYR